MVVCFRTFSNHDSHRAARSRVATHRLLTKRGAATRRPRLPHTNTLDKSAAYALCEKCSPSFSTTQGGTSIETSAPRPASSRTIELET